MLIEKSLPKNIVINGAKFRNKVRIAFFNNKETLHVVIYLYDNYLELETISSTGKTEKVRTDLLNIIPLISKEIKSAFSISENINSSISSALRKLL